MRNKIVSSFEAAISDVPDGATVLMHCFSGPAGVAQNLIRALRDKECKELTLVSCNLGAGKWAIQLASNMVFPSELVSNNQVRKVVTGWVTTRGGSNPFKEAVKAGKVEVELVGQGTLAARLRAGGSGIPAFYSPVGVGTILAAGKEKHVINGREFVLEHALRGDFGFVRAHKADEAGNLIYHGTSRSYNPLIAMAADIVIAEVDEIVPAGELDPEQIVTPGIFVDRIVLVKEGEYGSPSHLRKLLMRVFELASDDPVAEAAGLEAGAILPASPAGGGRLTKPRLDRETIALRAAKEFSDGDLVNLGFGIPTLCSLFVPEGRTVLFHSENGAVGFGPILRQADLHLADFDYSQAGGNFFSAQPSLSFQDHGLAFDIVRGGHLDKTVLGGLQVSEKGDLANWSTGQTDDAGIGGAMDMPVGAKRVIVTMAHTTKSGKPRIVRDCTYPLTAPACVDLIITDLSVIEVTGSGLVLREIAPGWTVEEVQALTEPTLIVADDLTEITL